MKQLSEVTRKDHRVFGMAVGSIFMLVWILKALVRGVPIAHSFSLYPVVSTLGCFGVILFVLGILAPSSLRYPYIPFFYFGRTISRLNTALLLFLSYVLFILPLGGLLRIFGKDPMQKKWSPEAPTYWIPREEKKRKSLISERQF